MSKLKIGDKVRVKNPRYGDDKVHVVLNVQKTHGDDCVFLHYYNWIDEDELELVEGDMEVKIDNKYRRIEDNVIVTVVNIREKLGTKINKLIYYVDFEDEKGNYSDLGLPEFKKQFVEYLGVAEIFDVNVTKEDIVQSPAHYNSTSITALEVIEDWNLGFHLGNVVKYIARNEKKGTQLQDLKKAQQYLELFINKLEKDGNTK